MPLITIDKEKCRKDGICITECPFNILKEGADGIPEMVSKGESVCMRCGHCLAVCPSGALTLDGLAPESCEAVRKDLAIETDAMAHLIKTRRSVRVYKDKPVSRDTAARLIDTVRWAPTAKNLQPVHWAFVDNRETIRKMASLTIDWFRENQLFPEIIATWDKKGEDLILRDAPFLAIAHAHEASLAPSVDCTIAVTTLELAASAMGIGGCWAGYFMEAASHYAPLKEALALPEGHHLYAALMLGYPKFKYQCIPQRNEAKVSWIS